MKTPVPVLVLLSVLYALAWPAGAKPLQIPNDAWRPSALKDVAQLLRPCLGKADAAALPRLPVFKGPQAGIEAPMVLQEPPANSPGHTFRLGYRARDGQVFVLAQRSADATPTVFGPVGPEWTCLPAEVRKELTDK